MYDLVTELLIIKELYLWGLLIYSSTPDVISWNVILVVTFEWVQNIGLLICCFVSQLNLWKCLKPHHSWSCIVFSDFINWPISFFWQSNRHTDHTCIPGNMDLTPRVWLSFWDSPYYNNNNNNNNNNDISTQFMLKDQTLL